MAWAQRTIRLAPRSRGCHLVTDEIRKAVAEDLKRFSVGIAHVFIQHTSASLTINENADPDVRKDMEAILNRVVPEKGVAYAHDAEGPDDMPAHGKASLFGSSVTIPITRGDFNLGTWQGIWLCEHRDHGGARSVVITLNGEAAAASASAGAGKS